MKLEKVTIKHALNEDETQEVSLDIYESLDEIFETFSPTQIISMINRIHKLDVLNKARKKDSILDKLAHHTLMYEKEKSSIRKQIRNFIRKLFRR